MTSQEVSQLQGSIIDQIRCLLSNVTLGLGRTWQYENLAQPQVSLHHVVGLKMSCSTQLPLLRKEGQYSWEEAFHTN